MSAVVRRNRRALVAVAELQDRMDALDSQIDAKAVEIGRLETEMQNLQHERNTLDTGIKAMTGAATFTRKKGE